MNAEEFIKQYYRFNYKVTMENMSRCMEKFATQKVVEELEALKLCNGVSIDLEITIDEIIKELKQKND